MLTAPCPDITTDTEAARFAPESCQAKIKLSGENELL
jgi:hypothetical protein